MFFSRTTNDEQSCEPKQTKANDRAIDDRQTKKRNEKRSCEDRRKVRDSGFAGFGILGPSGTKVRDEAPDLSEYER